MALSEMAVRNAKPQSRAYKITDERGMCLYITPAGGKLWRFNYRFAGKQKTLALGKYPEISLRDARDRREDARRLLARGIDPGQARREKSVAVQATAKNVFANVAKEWFAVWSPGKNESTIKKCRQRLDMYLMPTLGEKTLDDISTPDALKIARLIEAKGARDLPRKVNTILSQIIEYGIVAGARVLANPCPAVTKMLARPATRHMAALTDPGEVAQLLRAIDAYAAMPRTSLVVSAALRLAPLLFVRPGELRQARWPDIDLLAAEWRYVVSKTKTLHLVPLPRQAVTILEGLLVLRQNEWVFPGARHGRPMSDATINRALQAMGYDTKTEITGHGFRAMAKTMLSERLRYKPEAIERQLAHKTSDPLGGAYDRAMYIDERREMMQSWADYLDGLKLST